jgi:hypothetical protein
MTLTIDLPPELAQQLAQEAARYGQAPAEYVRAVIVEKLTGAPSSPGEGPAASLYAGLPRRDPRELADRAREQGAPLSVHFDDLLGDFWPEDESADEFMATLREWRREGRPASEE